MDFVAFLGTIAMSLFENQIIIYKEEEILN